MTNHKIRIAIIGFGRMGRKHLEELQRNAMWEVVYICDISEQRKEEATRLAPGVKYTSDEDEIFNDPTVDAVSLCTLADQRARHIEKAVRSGKHIIAEKPIAFTLEDEQKVVELTEHATVQSTVNMYLQNAWYTRVMKEFVQSGEIGELAIIRVCHMTPGLSPGEGHEFEGPSFHDCGMHYVNIARWFAGSEFSTGHAQAVRMWDYKDPWWLQCHGTFKNGIVYDITQGFVYGQLSAVQTHNSYMELIGTKGFVRMHHDFKTAVVEKHGVTVTESIERPYGDKNIDRLYEQTAWAIRHGDSSRLPSFRDSVIASEFAWKMLEDSRKNDLPSIGTNDELIAIRDRRAKMTDGYGLLHKKEE